MDFEIILHCHIRRCHDIGEAFLLRYFEGIENHEFRCFANDRYYLLYHVAKIILFFRNAIAFKDYLGNDILFGTNVVDQKVAANGYESFVLIDVICVQCDSK